MPSSAEQHLLSAILRTRDLPGAITKGACAELFDTYRDEWGWLVRYHAKHHRTPSRVAFRHAFQSFTVMQTDDVAHWVEECRKMHARRSLTMLMKRATDLLADNDVDRAVSHLYNGCTSVAMGLDIVRDTDILGDWEDTFNEAKRRQDQFIDLGYSGFPTGFDTLDDKTGGPQPGQHWVWGGRLGHGKTSVLIRMACSAVMTGHVVQFNALEMSRIEVAMRVHTFLSNDVGKSVFKALDLAQGRNYSATEYKKFLGGLKDQIKGSLHVSDAKVGVAEIAAQIEKNNPDIVFIDYLTLLRTEGKRDWSDWGNVSKDIKDMAKRYGVVVHSAAQLNRTASTSVRVGPAGAEALAQSDAIGQDADAVVTIKQTSPVTIEMLMAKYRHGPSDFKWYCHYDMNAGIFKEVRKDDYEDIRDRAQERNDQ